MKDFKFLFEKYVLGQHNTKYEPEVKKEMLRIYGNLFVDIGADGGRYCRLLHSHFNKIIAFEPNPFRYKYPANTELREMALSNKTGIADFYLNNGNGSADTLIRDWNYNPGYDRNMIEKKIYHTDKIIRVKTSTYDREINESAALVKVDVEGAELDVLDGMRSSLSSNKIHTLMVELHDIDRLENLLKLLSSYGYKNRILDKHPRIWSILPN